MKKNKKVYIIVAVVIIAIAVTAYFVWRKKQKDDYTEFSGENIGLQK